ncbi:hypothetical protein GCM10023080_091900 [Streptomyces pseudoechinosporeus]
MTDASAMVPLVSELGGAVIGAAAAIYVPMRQRRRQSREEERSRRESLLREEISTLTRLCTRPCRQMRRGGGRLFGGWT